MSSAHECGIRSICQAMDDATTLHKNMELKIALIGDGDVVVTPCRGPPTPEAVKAWARDKLTKQNLRRLGQQKEDLPRKKLEQIKEPSKDEHVESIRQDLVSKQKKTDANTSKSTTGVEQAIPRTSGSKLPSQKLNEKLKGSSLDADVELLVEGEHKALAGVESEKKVGVMELSDSSSSVEVTSPYSLFSPNEAKMFTFTSGSQTEVGKLSHKENHDGNQVLGTQPMSFECHGVRSHLEGAAVTSAPCSVTVTPSILRSPEQPSAAMNQPLSPLLQAQSPVFTAPYHSTPVATKLVYGAQSPRCTPISDTTAKRKGLDANIEQSEKKNAGNQASTDQTPSLRQQLLASQFKVQLIKCF